MKLKFPKLSWPQFAKINWNALLIMLPFAAFCIGYFALHFFMSDPSIQAPDLVGKDILQATKLCSDLQLNLRIIAEKEIFDAQAGTIITQNPAPKTAIKAHQSLFIIITKLPDPVLAPNLISKNCAEIEKICKEKGIKDRSYFLPSHHAANTCFAQMPAVGMQLDGKKMNCYISTGNQQLYLFPDFTNHKLSEVVEFLQHQHISFDVYVKDQKLTAPYKNNFLVSYQKPLAGTFIIPNNKLYVQLQVVIK